MSDFSKKRLDSRFGIFKLNDLPYDPVHIHIPLLASEADSFGSDKSMISGYCWFLLWDIPEVSKLLLQSSISHLLCNCFVILELKITCFYIEIEVDLSIIGYLQQWNELWDVNKPQNPWSRASYMLTAVGTRNDSM